VITARSVFALAVALPLIVSTLAACAGSGVEPLPPRAPIDQASVGSGFEPLPPRAPVDQASSTEGPPEAATVDVAPTVHSRAGLMQRIRERSRPCIVGAEVPGSMTLIVRRRADGSAQARADDVERLPADVVDCILAVMRGLRISPEIVDAEVNVPFPDEIRIPLRVVPGAR